MSSSAGPSPVDNGERPFIRPSKLGQFIALDACPQYFEYEFNEDIATRRRNEKNWKEAFEPLSLLLAKAGREFESQTIDSLSTHARSIRSLDDVTDWNESKRIIADTIDRVSSLDPETAPVILTEVRFGIQIETWPVAGDADIVAIWPTEHGVKIRIFEIKATHEEKTYHQLQVAAYTLLCNQLLESIAPDHPWEIEGGVIHQETVIDDAAPESLPSFPLETREMDVKRLLQAGGQLDVLWQRDPESVRYQLAPKCHTCAYKESCYTDAIENDKPALLGLSRGEQARLERHNITSLHDLAELAYPPNDPRPYEYQDLTPANRATYDALVSEPGIGERLPQYIQQAHALLNELDPESMYTSNTSARAPWLVGSGNGELPEDDPAFDDEYLTIERGSLIRCYLHVEWDHRNDRIVMLSAYVTASNYAENPRAKRQETAVVTSDYPVSDTDADRLEREVLTEFFGELFPRIRTVGEGMGRPSHAPVHFYCFAPDERTKLVDAVRRHDSHTLIGAARDLLGLRGAIDQSMMSVVQNELRSRIALPVNNTGLLPAMRYFQPQADFFPQSAWEYARPDGTTIDLRNAFRFKFFDYAVPYAQNDAGICLYPDGDPDGFYPSRARQGSHIPIEYVWGALGRLDDDWTESVSEEYNPARTVDPFRWVDAESKSTRIIPGDLRALGTRLARCVAHVERGIRYRNADIEKRPLDLTELDTFSLGDNSLRRAGREYLQLEHRSHRQSLFALYRLPVKQRIQRGDSIPFVVTEAEETETGRLVVEGRVLYDQMFEDGDRVAGACRQKGPTKSTGGSWMVANELDRQGNPVGSSKPRDIERGPGVMIEELDMDAKYIRVSSIPMYLPADRDFRRRHRQWTTDPSEANQRVQCFEENRIFVLDPRSDDLTAQRAFDVLGAGDSFASTMIDELASGAVTNPQTSMCSEDAVASFLEWLDRDDEPSPNEAQRAFIKECHAQFSLLQGPPGTGKTSGALANAVLARVYSFAERQTACAGLVTAESNKAVDEVLEDIADGLVRFESAPDTDDRFDPVRLVRLTSSPPADPHPRVEYLDYHADRAALRSLVRHLGGDETSTDQAQIDPTVTNQFVPHVIVFGTPARVYGLINALDIECDESVSPADRVRADESFFDFLAVDEASMMRLPSFLLAGAFVHEHAQVLIGGDHRQLPPVQQHEWETETRRTIAEYAPFLSTLDYFRAVRGAALDVLPDECTITGSATVPFHQLERTYRCHTDLTTILHRHVYREDNIEFRSDQTGRITDPIQSTDGINTAIEPAAPVTLVIHDDTSSQQSNRPEAALCAELSRVVHEENETGIVTPHNAQRGLIGTIVPDGIEVETVERYQGGERDCILVSATASDPDFLRAERDFILNPNRLNVAMSRMKKKLVVIASRSVFELVPPDVEQYDRAGLWKGLFADLGVIDREPEWAGSLGEILPSGRDDLGSDLETEVSVYTLSPDDCEEARGDSRSV